MSDSRPHVADRFLGHVPLRLLIPLILVIFAAIVGMGEHVMNKRAVEQGIEREAVRDLNLDMTRLQASLEEAGRINNPRWMQEQMAAFGADTHGLLAALADENDRVLASASRLQIGQLIQDTIPAALRELTFYKAECLNDVRSRRIGAVELTRDGSTVLSAFSVLLGKRDDQIRPDRIGLVLVARDLEILKSQGVAGARQKAVAIGLFLLGSAALVSVLLHVLVTRRLARISNAADKVAAGNFSTRSGVQGWDEIALLGRSFDAMVDDFRANEAALIESEERHRSLFENAVEGIVTMGEDRLIRSVNPAAQEMFGYSEEELIGKNVKILMPSPYHEEHDGYVTSYVESGEKKIIGIGREVVGKRRDGSMFPLELSVAEMRLTKERVFTGILRDVTDRKRAEDELRRVNEHLEDLVRERTKKLEDAQETLVRNERLATLGQLAGSVAHEIRTPLGVVRNAAYYVEQMTSQPDQDMAESFEEIRRGLIRADGIIAELLDYARDSKTKNHAEFLLKGAINDAVTGVSFPGNVTLEYSDLPETLICHGDRDQVARIIHNLVINGVQAMPDGGVLKLHCLESGNHVVVEVIDDGIGMTEGQRAKVFEPLFTTKTRGIGLGLALSQRYAQMNNSTLTVESRSGEGSAFRLKIPVIRGE